MARTKWLVDGRGIAMKVKNATHLSDFQKNGRSEANIICPNCNHKIDNSDMAHEWPGLPAGVKFDPSDQELLEHLAAKIGIGNARPHVYVDEFILTLEGNNGICYTHPEELPGVKQDGSAIHFFHRTARAYTTGNRKRRKIQSARDDVRWHKTGKTRPVFENGEQKGCKKIMVLYMTSAKGSKADKTNWVMHQYHLGTEEDEKDGEFVVSKIFYQKQQRQINKDETEEPQDGVGTCINGDPVTPKTSAPAPPRSEKCYFNLDVTEEGRMHCMDPSGQLMGESLFCDEILENHSSDEKHGVENCVPSLPDSGRLQGDEIKNDLHHPADASPELANIELDTPPEVHVTDSLFSSQESISGWLTKNIDWLANDKSSTKPGENLGDSQCST